MRREAWIGLSASLLLHGALAALLVVSVDARPGATGGGGGDGTRTRVRLVARSGAEGGGEPVEPPSAPRLGAPKAAAPAVRGGDPGGRPPPVAEAEAPAAVPAGAGASSADVSVAETTGVTGEAATGDAAAAGETGTVSGAATGTGSGSGTATGSGTGTGTGPGTGTGIGDGAGSGAGGTSSAPDDRHDRAVATLSTRLSSAARTCYPPAARRLRLRGDVAVRFCLDGSGRAVSLEVERSSGSPLLDRAALECVVPRALPVRDAGGCFSLPVRFGE